MDQAGVDDLELAQRCSTSQDVVEEWLEGEQQPTKTQFRRLVARLRRPAAIYFLEEPPAADPILREFRGPPGAPQARELTDPEFLAIQTAERLQKVARWVRSKREGDSVVLPGFRGGQQFTESIRQARAFLDWTVTLQLGANSGAEVARLLRRRLEDVGILVLQFPMAPAGCRGFSLADELAPVIAVNSAYTVEARIFTYMHEFAHLARGSGAICRSVPDSSVERRCERFAAAFLMPRLAFEAFLDDRYGDRPIGSMHGVSQIARRFRVSLRATALRLEHLGRAVEGLYEMVDAEADFKGGGGFSRDNTAPAKRLREWGTGYATLLVEAGRQGLLGRTDLLEYFNLSNRQLHELETRLEAGGDAEG